MFEPFQKAIEDLQMIGRGSYDAVLHPYDEFNKSFHAIGTRLADYSSRAYKDAIRAFEQLVGANSVEDVIEIQSQYANQAYNSWAAEASILSEMYAVLARDVFKPVGHAVAKRSV